MSGSGRLAGRVWLLVLAVLLVVAYGIIGYALFDFPLPDAVYLTVLTLTTEGFAAPEPLSPGAKVFTASLALLGVTVFLAGLGLLGTALVEGQLLPGSRRRRMQRNLRSLHDHLIICAYGRVGRAVARELEAEQIPFVVIDAKPELERDLQRDGVLYLIGSPSSEPVLRQAGVEHARGLVCAVDSDAENVYITLVARSLNPELAIVARAAEEASADRLYRAGANRVVSPYVTSGRRMALLALRPHVVDFFEIARRGGPESRLEELLVPDGSQLAGRCLGEVLGGAIPLLVRRATGELLPNPGQATTLPAGDVVVVFGEPRTLRPIEGG
jgi:voltage-gated potassium channel